RQENRKSPAATAQGTGPDAPAPISKTDLPLRYPGHRSILVALRSSGARSLQRLDISRRRLVQQILQSPPVVQAALNFRHKLSARRRQHDALLAPDRTGHNFDAARQTGTPGNSRGCTGYAA